MTHILTYARLLRIDQWVKNGFLFLPLFFDRSILNTDHLFNTTLGFLAFALTSSFIYILNDFRDIESDRLHPTKKNRPQASGAVGTLGAWTAALTCLVLAGVLVATLQVKEFGVILGIYVLLNTAYSLGLKKVALLDIFLPASGYVLRVYAGGVISDIQPSAWLTIMSFLLALFMILAKRRDDVVISISSGNQLRKSLSGYNQVFLNTALSMISGIIVVAYCMYTLSPETQERFSSPYLYFTVVYVIAGVLRYLQIGLVEQNAGSPSDLLYKDRFLQIVVVAWLTHLFVIIY